LKASDELADEVIGLCGAPAVSKDENLAAFLQTRDERFGRETYVFRQLIARGANHFQVSIDLPQDRI
jgi:hypothetical protein